jgi:hypothetical protein
MGPVLRIVTGIVGTALPGPLIARTGPDWTLTERTGPDWPPHKAN